MQKKQPMPQLSATKSSTALRRRPALLTLLGLTQVLMAASLGCRSTSDNQIDLLERELRTQEDYIYELESYVVEYSEKLRETRCEFPQQTAIYSEELRTAEPAPPFSNKSSPSNKSSYSNRKKQRRPDKEKSILDTGKGKRPSPSERERKPVASPEAFSPEKMEVPGEIEFEIGEPVSGLEEVNPLRQVVAIELDGEPSDEGLLIIPDPVDFESSLEDDASADEQFDEQFDEALFADEQVEETVAFVDRVADRLEVTQLFQGEGDELSPQSLLTVVEALDAKGEPIDLDGEISLMVMTADETAPRRLKRWNFTTEETIAAWQSSDLGDGLHLELPLEKVQLPATPLELWVRLVTVDGRKLLTQLPFDASQLSSMNTGSSEPTPQGLSVAEVEESAQPLNSLRIETESIRQSKKLKLVDAEEPTNQPRWRASTQRTDRTAEGFATTTSGNTLGWTTQSPGRLPYVPARVASRTSPMPATRPARPVWTSGRSVLPVVATGTNRR